MDNFNPDLIFDLAAGLLPEAEARAAEASLTAAGRAELDAQRAVLAAVADAPPVGLTDIERAHLHRSVASAITETTREFPPARVAAAGSPARRSRSMMWMRWASVATAAAMFVGVVAVGSQLGSGGGDDAAADPVAALTDTTSAVGMAAEESRQSTADGALSAGDGIGGGDALGAAESTGEDVESLFLLESTPPLDEAPADSDLKALNDFVTEAIDARRIPVAGITILPCYEVAAEDDDLDVVSGFLVPFTRANGEELDAIAFADAGTAATVPLIRVYDPATCEPLAVNE